jgi:Skp family chaperone for outer membrane proteins
MMRIFKIIATVAAFIGGILFFLRPKASEPVPSPFAEQKKELQGKKEELEKELAKVEESGYTDKDEIEKKYNS